jgi:hypothetical protein
MDQKICQQIKGIIFAFAKKKISLICLVVNISGLEKTL